MPTTVTFLGTSTVTPKAGHDTASFLIRLAKENLTSRKFPVCYGIDGQGALPLTPIPKNDKQRRNSANEHDRME